MVDEYFAYLSKYQMVSYFEECDVNPRFAWRYILPFVKGGARQNKQNMTF